VEKGKKIAGLLILIVLTIQIPEVYSQNQAQKPTRQSAFDAFTKGNFEDAAGQFEMLSSTYPKDPVINIIPVHVL
jgi:hypothetical protein